VKLKKLRWPALIISSLTAGSVVFFQNCAHQTDFGGSASILEPVIEGADNHSRLIAAGNSHSCVTNKKGQVYCWGKNRFGLSGGANFPADVLIPVKQEGLENIVQLAAGNDTNCALSRGGEVFCWGSNANWGLGIQNAASGPTAIKVLEGVKYIDGDYMHFCAVMNAGTVKCWGNSTGVQSIGNTPVPTDVVGMIDIEKVNVGLNHACALNKLKKLKCWGTNNYKIIENANLLEDIASVDAGLSHACALKTNGSAVCWGLSNFGQSGNPQPGDAPVEIQLPQPAKKVVAGANTTCALLLDGAVSCWGNNVLGQFGFASTQIQFSAVPVIATGISGAVDLAMGADHACVVLQNRSVRCWGVNAQGQLGNGSLALSYSASPIEVAGLPRL
jgi:alpha-tubulin suppressor-like RCC1 family protein